MLVNQQQQKLNYEALSTKHISGIQVSTVLSSKECSYLYEVQEALSLPSCPALNVDTNVNGR